MLPHPTIPIMMRCEGAVVPLRPRALEGMNVGNDSAVPVAARKRRREILVLGVSPFMTTRILLKMQPKVSAFCDGVGIDEVVGDGEDVVGDGRPVGSRTQGQTPFEDKAISPSGPVENKLIFNSGELQQR